MRLRAPSHLLLLLLLLCFSLSSPTVAATTSDVNIAYFIQVSDATVTLLPRLLRTLWHVSNLHVIHFDKKIPQWQREHAAKTLLSSDSRYTSNVHIMQSEPVTYRGISMVLNNLNAMQQALLLSDDWTYFINISGADYPLVSPKNQRRLLATRDILERNRSFISVADRGWWQKSKEYRYDRLFTDTSLGMNDSSAEIVDSYTDQPIAKINNFTFVAAEAWMILHRTFVTYLLQSAFSRRMLLAFAYSLEPEEHFFPTVMWNCPRFNQSTIPHALRHVAWNHNGKHSGQHPYYIDRFEKDGITYMFKDSVVKSGCLFTRKIRTKDSPLLNFIDRKVSGVAKDSDEDSVNEYLNRVNRVLDCLVACESGTKSNKCFPEWTE